jgi:hypothetical protein
VPDPGIFEKIKEKIKGKKKNMYNGGFHWHMKTRGTRELHGKKL